MDSNNKDTEQEINLPNNNSSDRDEIPSPPKGETTETNNEKDSDSNKPAKEQVPLLEDNSNTTSSRMMAIVSIIAGILIIAAGFTIYQYFTDVAIDTDKTPLAQVNLENTEDNKDDNNTTNTRQQEQDSSGIIRNTQEEDREDSSGIDVSDLNETTANNDTTDTTSVSREASTINNNSQLATWTANDYRQGDVSTGEYTVTTGDTLWELAEAAYGDGTQWHKIADANNVDYLLNGNPLIIPGQTLTIPALTT